MRRGRWRPWRTWLPCGEQKKRKGKEGNVATATECLHVSYAIVVISHAAGPAAPRHPPQRHVEHPAAPGRRARRAAGRRDHALLRGEVDGPDRGDTVDEETAEETGETHLGGHVLHGGAAAGRRPPATRDPSSAGVSPVLADTMPMPAAAAPITDCSPAPRSCAAPRSSKGRDVPPAALAPRNPGNSVPSGRTRWTAAPSSGWSTSRTSPSRRSPPS